MTYCELCDLDLAFCVHGRPDPERRGSIYNGPLLISPKNMVHFPGCMHKGDDPDMSQWAKLDTPDAWQRLGNGEHLPATGGARPDRVATSRCGTCLASGPW